MKNTFLLLLIIFLSAFTGKINAQSGIEKGERIIHGFGEKISGKDFIYQSHVDYAKDALWVVSRDEEAEANWKTDPVHKGSGQFVNFVWIGGISGKGAGKKESTCDLFVNGEKYLTFLTSDGSNGFAIENEDGGGLTFLQSLRDGNDDRFGTMILKLPAHLVKEDKPVELKIKSQKGGNGSWVMVFKSKLKESKLNASIPPLLLKENKRLVRLSLDKLSAPEKGLVFLDDEPMQPIDIKFGTTDAELFIDEVDKEKVLKIEIRTDSESYKKEVTIRPVKKMEVAFVQHTHTDIGYTRPQTEILGEHVRFIDYALDYCDATDHYPEEAQFRWTCETAWAVEEYVKTRPASQVDRLVKRIKEGRIELTAMFFNFDGLPDETTLAASLKPYKTFKELGINNVELAMQNDVNGLGWCFTEYFEDLGIKYLTMGENNHRALIPYDEPTYFWWESPSGKKIMAYVGEHYMAGNAVISDFENFEKSLSVLLNKRADYQYETFALQFMGCSGDNSPPSIKACENIIKWNEKYKYPKIRLSLYKDFFATVEEKYGSEFHTIRGAWPDWWTDGFGSGAREASAYRQAQVNNVSNQIGLSLAKLLGINIPDNTSQRIDELEQSLLFYGEHTFGASESVREPFSEHTMLQRSLKSSYAWEAYRRSCVVNETVLGLLQGVVSKAEKPSIVVFNPLNWEYSGLVKIYADHVVLPHNGEFTISDANGNIVPAQIFLNRGDGAFWTIDVKDLPAMGYKQFFVDVNNKPKPKPDQEAGSIIENDWYKISLDKNNGTITSLFDKQLQKELLDENAEWKMGEFIHEKLESRSSHERHEKGNVTRSKPKRMAYKNYHSGSIWDSYIFTGETETGQGKDNLSVEIKVYHEHKRIDFSYGLRKKLNTEAEAVYVSFPFKLQDAKPYFEVPGGNIQAGVDQVPGTSNDWNAVQNFATVRNEDKQIVLVSHEVPLMQFGNINTGRYQKDGKPESEKIYSYVMNNYWTTNYNADQHGGFKWSYNLTSLGNNDILDATRFGVGCRTPFLYRVLQASPGGKKVQAEGSFLTIAPQNVLVVNMQPVENKNEVILHLREINGEKVILDISSTIQPKLKFRFCDVLGEEIQYNKNEFVLNPWETRFVKLSW